LKRVLKNLNFKRKARSFCSSSIGIIANAQYDRAENYGIYSKTASVCCIFFVFLFKLGYDKDDSIRLNPYFCGMESAYFSQMMIFKTYNENMK